MLPESPSCLISIPVQPEFQLMRETVVQALEKFEVKPFFAGDDSPATITTDQVRRADFAVVDISSGSPNTFYLLGVCDAFRKPVLILYERSRPLPVDVKGMQVISYGREEVPRLGHFLNYWLKDRLAAIGRQGAA